MGMSASQARLLTLTSRMSDLELQAQQIGNAKIRLSQKTAEAAADYNGALTKGVLQVQSTGTDGKTSYIDASAYNLTTYGAVPGDDTQRFLKNQSGQVLVSQNVETAYNNNKNNLSGFLKDVGCSDEAIKHLSNKEAVSNITSLAAKLQSSSFYTSTTATVNSASDAVQQAAAISASLKSMKGSLTSMQVDATNRKDTVAATNIGKVIALIDQETKLLDIPANQTSPSIVDMEQMILKLITGGAVTPTAQETSNFTWNGLNTLTLSDYTSTGKNINTVSVSADNAKPDEIQKAGFYTEVFNQIKDSGGCFSKTDDEMKSNEWLTSQLLSGGLTLVEYTDPTDSKKKSWNEVSWSAGDTTLKQSTDDTQIAKAEAKYDEETSAIQVKDKTFDLQLANINTEHSAVQTEIDTVKSVIDKNVKSSFKLFQA